MFGSALRILLQAGEMFVVLAPATEVDRRRVGNPGTDGKFTFGLIIGG